MLSTVTFCWIIQFVLATSQWPFSSLADRVFRRDGLEKKKQTPFFFYTTQTQVDIQEEATQWHRWGGESEVKIGQSTINRVTSYTVLTWILEGIMGMMRRNEAKSASRGTLCVCVCVTRGTLSVSVCACVFTLMTHKARCIQEKRKGGVNFCHIRCRPFKCIRMTFETLQWFEAWNGQFPPLLSVKTSTEFRTFLRRTKIEIFKF